MRRLDVVSGVRRSPREPSPAREPGRLWDARLRRSRPDPGRIQQSGRILCRDRRVPGSVLPVRVPLGVLLPVRAALRARLPDSPPRPAALAPDRGAPLRAARLSRRARDAHERHDEPAGSPGPRRLGARRGAGGRLARRGARAPAPGPRPVLLVREPVDGGGELDHPDAKRPKDAQPEAALAGPHDPSGTGDQPRALLRRRAPADGVRADDRSRREPSSRHRLPPGGGGLDRHRDRTPRFPRHPLHRPPRARLRAGLGSDRRAVPVRGEADRPVLGPRSWGRTCPCSRRRSSC